MKERPHYAPRYSAWIIGAFCLAVWFGALYAVL